MRESGYREHARERMRNTNTPDRFGTPPIRDTSGSGRPGSARYRRSRMPRMNAACPAC